ncbi:MAG: nucleotidyltransferase domain-containing protein [Candidatus Paceibacterota bacterium]|jgi:hypothetical protein
MEINDLIKDIRQQNFPQNEFAIFGSAVMAIRGIREAPNIDVIVTDRLWIELLKTNPLDSEGFIRIGSIKISNWWFAPTNKDINQMINEAEKIKGLPFVKLEEVLYYKKLVRRDKDLIDINLINNFLASLQSENEPVALGVDDYNNFLEEFKQKVNKECEGKVLSIILFGSVARGEARGSSDIDLLIIFDEEKISRKNINNKFIQIIKNSRRQKTYLDLSKKSIYPEIYPVFLSSKHLNSFLWLFLDISDHGIIFDDNQNIGKKFLEDIKDKIKNTNSKKSTLPSGKWCWVLPKNF